MLKLTPQDFIRRWQSAELNERAAYGWPSDLTDEQILERLLALNL